MFRLCLNFYLDISFTSSKLSSQRIRTKNQICVSSLLHINRFFSYYFVLGHSGNPIFLLMYSAPIKVKLSLNRVLSTFLNQLPGFYLGFFVWGGRSILKKIFGARRPREKIFLGLLGGPGMFPRKILKR